MDFFECDEDFDIGIISHERTCEGLVLSGFKTSVVDIVSKQDPVTGRVVKPEHCRAIHLCEHAQMCLKQTKTESSHLLPKAGHAPIHWVRSMA